MLFRGGRGGGGGRMKQFSRGIESRLSDGAANNLFVSRQINCRLLLKRALNTLSSKPKPNLRGKQHKLCTAFKVRNYSHGPIFFASPKSPFTFFRLFWAAASAMAGYAYYQVGRARDWWESAKFSALHALLNVYDSLPSVGGNSSECRDDRSTFDKDFKSNALKHEHGPNGASGPENEFTGFIKRMLEIKWLLDRAGLDDDSIAAALPKIVVVGAQSSGKSTVLESIVGVSFLPKGRNMVTRCPLEIDLINTRADESSQEAHHNKIEATYAVLDGKVFTDFADLQKTLTDANMQIDPSQGISPTPIRLKIYSPHTPTLSLIDLPGYIVTTNTEQPTHLPTSIQKLCRPYLEEEGNVILAVSAGDVDLANSEALSEARSVDPHGNRTIGVITKMDLLPTGRDGEREDRQRMVREECAKYPLALGYVFSGYRRIDEGNDAGYAYGSDLGDRELHHKEISKLKQKLLRSLEATMANHLSTLSTTISHLLQDSLYTLKVQFNDQRTTLPAWKHECRMSVGRLVEAVRGEWGRERIEEELVALFDEMFVDWMLARWNHHHSNNNNNNNNSSNNNKTSSDLLSLASRGIGRIATKHIAKLLTHDIQHHLSVGEQQQQQPRSSNTKHHPSKDFTHTHPPALLLQLQQTLVHQLDSQESPCATQIETALKPHKHNTINFDDDADGGEWIQAHDHIDHTIDTRMGTIEQRLREIKGKVGGGGRLAGIVRVMREVEEVNLGDNSHSDANNAKLPPSISKQQLDLAMEALNLHTQLTTLQSIKHSLDPCTQHRSWWGLFTQLNHTLKQYNHTAIRVKECEYIGNYLVTRNLLKLASFHLHHELVRPLSLHTIDDESIEASIKGDDGSMNSVRTHLDLVQRIECLEEVEERLRYLMIVHGHHHQK